MLARNLLARNIRWCRFFRGWTQEELAERTGLHRTYISGIERKQRNTSIDNIEKLAQAFNLSIADLFEVGNQEIDKKEK